MSVLAGEAFGPSAAGHIRLGLVLGDAALAGMRLVPDPALEPGSLVIEGGEGAISDGPVEWRRAIAAAVRADC